MSGHHVCVCRDCGRTMDWGPEYQRGWDAMAASYGAEIAQLREQVSAFVKDRTQSREREVTFIERLRTILKGEGR
jgi:hypothetical protein